MGMPGLDGTDGDDGWSIPGPAGADGAAGTPGAAGAAGPMGMPGLDGYDGDDGWPGPAGATGPQGAPGAGGSGSSGTATLNFGAFPGASDTSVAVTGQAAIVAGSTIRVQLRPEATADHTADEYIVDGPEVLAGNIVAATGFTIYGITKDKLRKYGSWSVAWSWS